MSTFRNPTPMPGTMPRIARKFSSQFPQAEPDTQPMWGIKATNVAPCATCFAPTRFVDTAFETTDPATGETRALHFCSETCLDGWLDLLEKAHMAR